jgi:hypothetical protein
MNDSVGFPVGFYISLLLLGVAGAYAWKVRESGIGIPMGAVLATVGLWYFGDVFYNPYENYVLTIGPQYLEAAWWQVALFTLAFFYLCADRASGHESKIAWGAKSVHEPDASWGNRESGIPKAD